MSGRACVRVPISGWIGSLPADSTSGSHKDRASFAKSSRVVLAAASFLHVIVLAALPVSGTEDGESAREIHWNPLQAWEEYQEDQKPEETYSAQLSNGDLFFYSPAELSDKEREELLTLEPYSYFLHGDPEGPVISDSGGDEVTFQEESAVIRDIEGRIPTEPLEPAALILEEKTVNALHFVPVGIIAFHAFSSWAPRLLSGPALSVTIESVQWVMASGRSTDVGDLLINSLGSLIGTGMAVGSVIGVQFLVRNARK